MDNLFEDLLIFLFLESQLLQGLGSLLLGIGQLHLDRVEVLGLSVGVARDHELAVLLGSVAYLVLELEDLNSLVSFLSLQYLVLSEYLPILLLEVFHLSFELALYIEMLGLTLLLQFSLQMLNLSLILFV